MKAFKLNRILYTLAFLAVAKHYLSNEMSIKVRPAGFVQTTIKWGVPKWN